MQKLKEVARRGIAFAAAVGLLAGIGASALPMAASADSLNPLTERSLTLSSSSPGWSSVDGSGNSTYAFPNSGANGQKTGETFTFRVSSDATVQAFSLQYCTSAAGECQSPGNDTGGTPNAVPAVPRGSDSVADQQSDLNVVTATPTEVPDSATWSTINSRSSDPTNDVYKGIPKADNSEGNFAVLVPSNSGTAGNVADTLSTGWSMSAQNLEDTTGVNAIQTGKNNFIRLTNSTGAALKPGDQVKIVLFATDTNYITNPGDDAFFVKINDYSSSTYQNFRDGYPDTTQTGTDLIDGGVTVANIMNESIQIQTKVLETMDFSVGIIDPDTLTETQYGAQTPGDTSHTKTHGQCDPILTRMPGDTSTAANSLFLGDHAAEDSLKTNQAFDTHSYWRLSSNSSGGATVYYSGTTLKNTEGDQIEPIGDTESPSHTGTEQFGLGIDHGSDTTTLGGTEGYPVDYGVSTTDSSVDQTGLDASWTTAVTGQPDVKIHNPRLYPLVPEANYGDASGNDTSPNTVDDTIADNGSAEFAFNADANTVPVPIASENAQVVNCVTAKMRYIGNIAATTPAGIYATKINYLAAPQY